jgi:hypothetical protein
VATGTRAEAFQQEICGNGGTGWCMNDWNGANTYVKMYAGNSSHEDFVAIFNVSQCGNGKVHSTIGGDATDCPFGVKQLDYEWQGYPIGQIEYAPTGQCIGSVSSTDGTAYLGNCGNNSGIGGITGSTLIISSVDGTLIDRYWSDAYNLSGSCCISYGLTSGGNSGTPLYEWGYPLTSWGGF